MEGAKIMDSLNVFAEIIFYLQAFFLLVMIVSSIYTVLYFATYYKLAKKAYHEKPWLVFIPLGIPWIKFKTTNTPINTFFLMLGSGVLGTLLMSFGVALEFFPMTAVGFLFVLVPMIILFVVERKFLEIFGVSKNLIFLYLLGPLPVLVMYMVIAFGRSEFVGANDGLGRISNFSSFEDEEY